MVAGYLSFHSRASPIIVPRIRNPPKIMTTGIENMAECMKYVVKSSPATPQPVPNRIAPMRHLTVIGSTV
jgi:hypothetical protein